MRSQMRVRLFLFLPALFLMFAGLSSATAQTFIVLHNFGYQPDGGVPEAGLTPDINGDFYGTTALGGDVSGCQYFDCGTVFKLKRANGGWIYNLLYTFADAYGTVPTAPVTIGPNRTLYGSLSSGGETCKPNDCGVDFNLAPQPSICRSVLCSWNKQNIRTFSDSDADNGTGALVFDAAGNLYGVHPRGGDYGAGSVYQLEPSNGIWPETLLYSFQGGSDGDGPLSGVTMDASGNLYGTTFYGGGSQNCQGGCGTVYQLSRSGSGWTEQVLYAFTMGGDGGYPLAGVIRDAAGNLYGATSYGGSGGGGTVFRLSPSGGGWTFTTLYSFSGQNGPNGSLTFDSSGNLYGTTYKDGAAQKGSVFKLTASGGSWIYTDLHDFSGGTDGGYPYGSVALDNGGKIYGTASVGGTNSCNCGVIWQITQ